MNPHPALRATFSRGEKGKKRNHQLWDEGVANEPSSGA